MSSTLGVLMNRYHRISEIDDFGFFQNWRDTEHIAPHSFGVRTVIYGPNGAGKSTLAAVFAAVEQAQRGGQYDSRLNGVRVELTDGQEVSTGHGRESLPRTIVFNRDYVERNLRPAFETDEAIGEPIYAVGEQRVELAKQIEQTKVDLERAKQEHETTVQESKTGHNNERAVVDRIRNDVVDWLRAYDPHHYHMSQYKREHARKLMDDYPNPQNQSPEKLDELKRLLSSDPDDLPAPTSYTTAPNISDDLVADLSKFINTEVVAETVAGLRASPELAQWAQEGLDLHEPGDKCGFCGSEVTQERLVALRGHFADSYRLLQSEAGRLRARLDELDQELRTCENELPGLSREAGELGRWVASNEEELRAASRERRKWVDQAREIVKARDHNPLEGGPWNLPALSMAEPSIWDRLAEEVQRENERRKQRKYSLDSEKKKASATMLEHVAAKHRADYDAAQRDINNAHSPDNTWSRVEELQEVLERLQDREAEGRRDAEGVAQELNEDLSRYLSFRGLAVDVVQGSDGMGFKFQRNGQPATGLSEGEQGAVALLHFLRRLKAEDILQPNADGGEPIDTLPECCIVIDDPVSSFDNDTIVTAYSYLRDRLSDPGSSTGLVCAQLIVLTHNFHFMRLWINDDNRKGRTDENNAQGRGTTVDKLPDRRVAFLNIRPTLEGVDAPRRVAELRDLGSSRPARSEYHLLFEEVCRALEDGKASRLLLAGNAARRILESFVYWTWPQGENFRDTVESLGKHHNISTAFTNHVINVTNNLSHRTETDTTESQHVGNVDEDLRAVLCFVRECDGEHITRMCAALGVDEPALGPGRAQASDP